jgi:hypothetical protein
MPGRDGKGPQGAGPGTGGRRGPCVASATPAGSADDLRGAGRGYAPRGGGSRGSGFFGGLTQEETVQALKNRTAALERELAEIRSRIEACCTKNG